jgi:RsiW-degrading membrane proteinase PrsW (M82 family)
MRARPLLLVIGVIVVLGLLGGLVVPRLVRGAQRPEQRAARMAHSGEREAAEALYWSLLQRGPVTLPLVIDFLDNHQAQVGPELTTVDEEDGEGERFKLRTRKGQPVDDDAIDTLLSRTDLEEGVSLLGRFWRAELRGRVAPESLATVRERADAEPPMPFANHLLARAALRREAAAEAAERFAREGLAFDARAADLNLAIAVWMQSDAWDQVGEALADPRAAKRADAGLHFRYAVHVRDWWRAARWFVPSVRPHVEAGPLALTAIAALAWVAFLSRIGRALERPRLRVPLYVAAFVLGVASVYPTMLIITVEEAALHLVPSGTPLADFLFFTFGVGLREEVSKLLLFAFLLPFLRRRGTKVDVLVCGAMVGLGFAAEENLSYLQGGDLSTALARYLTANFLHMSMTAILATALDDFTRDTEKHAQDMSRAMLVVVALHGAYDFCLTSHAYGDLSFFAIAIFIVLARRFLRAVSEARGRPQRGDRLLETFAVGTAVVAATSYVYASVLVGPALGARVMMEGLLDVAIIVFMFAQELRRV